MVATGGLTMTRKRPVFFRVNKSPVQYTSSECMTDLCMYAIVPRQPFLSLFLFFFSSFPFSFSFFHFSSAFFDFPSPFSLLSLTEVLTKPNLRVISPTSDTLATHNTEALIRNS